MNNLLSLVVLSFAIVTKFWLYFDDHVWGSVADNSSFLERRGRARTLGPQRSGLPFSVLAKRSTRETTHPVSAAFKRTVFRPGAHAT
jgi:hypothetical protein